MQKITDKEKDVISKLIQNPFGLIDIDMLTTGPGGDCFMVFAVKNQHGDFSFKAVEQTYDQSAAGDVPEAIKKFDDFKYVFSCSARRLAKINATLGNESFSYFGRFDWKEAHQRLFERYKDRDDKSFGLTDDGMILESGVTCG